MAIIAGLQNSLVSVTQALQKVFQVTHKDKGLLPKKNPTKFVLKKMANTGGEGFLLTTKLYKKINRKAILGINTQNQEGKEAVDTEGTAIKKHKQTKNKQLETQKIHINELHTNLGHSG